MGAGLSCHPLPSHAVLIPGGAPPSGWLTGETNFIWTLGSSQIKNSKCTGPTTSGCGPYQGTTFKCLPGYNQVMNKCDDINECAPGGVAVCITEGAPA